jgi:hypothetical protein
MLKDGSVAQGTPYERAMTKYRRMQPQFRKLATTDFVDRYGETPDPLDEKDLLRLIAIGDAYRSNYSK